MDRLIGRLGPRGSRSLLSRILPVLGILLIALISAVFALQFIQRLGFKLFTVALGALSVAPLLLWISVRTLSVPLAFWLFSMSGFRGVGMVSMPGLPDFSIDRLFLAWLIVGILIRIATNRDRIRGPFAADAILIVHTVYILCHILITAPYHFHAWVVSNFMPLCAFLLGRAAISNERDVRNLLYFLFGISFYYYVTSIAEHFGWTFLIWPKQILDPQAGHLWHVGRSRGPIMHPPLFGQLQSMFLMVHFFFFVHYREAYKKAAVFFSFLLSQLGLLFAYTRAPWLATAVAFAGIGVFHRRYRSMLALLVILAVVGGFLGALQLANSEFLQERVQNESTFENRLSFFATALRIIGDHPLFGVGYFTAKKYVWLYNEGTYIPFYGFVKRGAGAHMVPHDIYIGRAADEGLVSLVILAIFGFLIVRAFRKLWRYNPQGVWINRDLLVLFAAIGVSYMMGGLGIDYRYFDLVNVVVFLLAGIVYRFAYDTESLPPAAAAGLPAAAVNWHGPGAASGRDG